MADRIQLDGRSYVPIAEAASIVAIDEKRIHALATEGKVLLRAIGKKIYVDLEGLQTAVQPTAVSVQPAPAALQSAPAPIPAPQIAALPVTPPKPALVSVAPAPVPTSTPMPTPAQVAKSPAAHHAMSSAELSAMGAPSVAPVPAQSKEQVKVAAAPVQKELPRLVVPPREFTRRATTSLATSVGAIATFVFVLGSGYAAYEYSPSVITWAGGVRDQLAQAVGSIGGNTVTYQPTQGTAGNVPLEYSPSEKQASAQAQTFPAATASTTQPIYYVYNYPVIERVVEEVRYINASTPQDFQAQLDALYQRIQDQIRGLSISTNTSFAQQYQVIAHTNKIDELGSVTITDSIWNGGTITGATITGGSVTATAFSGTLGISNGGTGTSTAPTYGQILVGDSSGGYNYVATSSLGLSASVSGTAGQIPYFESAGTTLTATSSLYIASTGNVGIGTTSPSTKLEVVKTSSGGTADQLYLTNEASATSTASRLTFRTADVTGSATSTGAITSILQQNFNTGKGDLAFSTLQSGTLTEVFRATSGGNLGIGTTTPLRRFAVEQAASAAQLAVAYDTTRVTEIQTDSSGDVVINPSGDDVRINDDNLWVCAGGSCPSGTPSGNGNLVVETKVGIGTSTPAESLDVYATNSLGGILIEGTTDPSLSFRGAGITGAYIGYVTQTNGIIAGSAADDLAVRTRNGGDILFSADNGNTSLLTLTNGNKVGIGTTSPTDMLSVHGLLRVGANSVAPVTMGTATSTFNGDIKIVGKLDVSTIDPVYTIDGIKYATYGHSTVGIKEEVVLKVVPKERDEEKGIYVHRIDFDSLQAGSDLWLFYQVTDFGKNWENLVVTLSRSFDGTAYYEEDIAANELRIYASQSGSVSLRLIANRFDFSKWHNLRPDQDGDTTGTHVIGEK